MNKHVEPEQEDKSYQLYGDGTMLIKVDGVYQRRYYEVVAGPTNEDVIWPDTHEGEEVKRTINGDISIVTCTPPRVMDVGFGKEEIHPLARIAQLAELVKGATQFNQFRGPASNVHAFAHEIAELAAQLSQEKLAAKPLTVSIDASEAVAAAQDYVQRFRMRTYGAMNASLDAGWRAYLDAPMARDMGRSKFNAGVTAAITYIMDNVLKD